ncbi:MAG: cation transporter [Oscillospiraceae bacterium]|jgi:copper ion binding protein|nr:cation transporter [Oscillospiraceae bacterium]
MEKLTIGVGGMSCSHCVKAVTDAISALPGTANVAVSLDDNAATFEYDAGLVTVDAIKAAIVEEGYEV